MPTDDPTAAMRELLAGFRVTQMLYVAAELGLPDVVAEGPTALDAIAAAVGAPTHTLGRLLRALAAHGVFVETERAVFAPTPLSDTLRGGASGSLRAMAVSYGQPWWWGAFGRLADTVRTGRPGFELEQGEPLFSYLAHEPEAAGVFNANMAAMTAGTSTAIADSHLFGTASVFVDVGGGSGALTSALLARWPHLRGVVFDRPAAIDGARRRGLAGERCELVEGDFFTGVPTGADVYILKDILHDWDDDPATAILRRCRAAMTDEARLLIVERPMPPGTDDPAVRHIDITMMVMTGGRERTVDEYGSLVEAAGLRLAEVTPLPGVGAVMQAVRGAL